MNRTMEILSRLAVLVACGGALCVVLMSAGVPARAAGGGAGGGSQGFNSSNKSAGERAITEYQRGERKIERAHELDVEALEALKAGDEKKASKLRDKSASMVKRAEKYQRKAIKYDENLFQAWSALGYALRRQGDFEEAIEAYDHALELEPRYAEAVEYRAEAYLYLGRFDDAKQGYLALRGWTGLLADKLMIKMDEWVDVHRDDPGEFDQARIEALAQWLEAQRAATGPIRSFSAADRAAW